MRKKEAKKTLKADRKRAKKRAKNKPRTSGSLKPNLEFEYSPDGHRVCKIVKPKAGTNLWTYTYYVRDAQGNIMATYDRTLEAIFDPEQPSYTNINAELVALNGAVAFKNFIQTLHPQISSTNFIDSLKQMVLDSSYELQFLNHFDPTYYLNNNFTYYSTVYSAFDNDKLITGFYTIYGESSFCNSLYTQDALGFVQYFVDQDASAYLIALNGYNSGTLYQMYLDAGGTPSTPPPGPGFMDTYIRGVWSNTQIADWITNNGGFSLHYSILQQYMSSLDIRTLLASYSNLKTAITAQYSTSDITDAMVAYSGTYVWSLLHPSVSAGTLLGEVFSHEPSNAYDVLVQYFWSLVAFVQTDNYYYSKTEYFDSIRTIYGQYTYDILVGKFITLSNQFKDYFVLSEWHLYGSSRLGIQKPNALNSYAQLTSATAGKGRELVHIEFSGSWSEYEVNYADTHYTTVTTYQMSYEYYSLTRGEKNYELVNHLGNVMAVVSDKRIPSCSNDTVNYYTADVVQATDYSAFGVILKGRELYASSDVKYRNGFNGKERDDEINGEGDAYNFGDRIYSSSLGKFLSPDPYSSKYPYNSPYQFAGNNPIFFIDNNGDSIWIGGDRSKAIEDVQSLLPERYRSLLTVDNAGLISFNINLVSQSDLNNLGIQLVNNLINSEKKYLYVVSNTFESSDRETGNRNVDIPFIYDSYSNNPNDAIDNLSKTPYGQTNPSEIPKDNFDGYVRTAKGEFTTESGGFTYNVSRAVVVFHELSENFYRTETKQTIRPGYEYASNGGMYYESQVSPGNLHKGGAHQAAGIDGKKWAKNPANVGNSTASGGEFHQGNFVPEN